MKKEMLKTGEIPLTARVQHRVENLASAQALSHKKTCQEQLKKTPFPWALPGLTQTNKEKESSRNQAKKR